jgi:hypothetical protein
VLLESVVVRTGDELSPPPLVVAVRELVGSLEVHLLLRAQRVHQRAEEDPSVLAQVNEHAVVQHATTHIHCSDQHLALLQRVV